MIFLKKRRRKRMGMKGSRRATPVYYTLKVIRNPYGRTVCHRGWSLCRIDDKEAACTGSIHNEGGDGRRKVWPVYRFAS